MRMLAKILVVVTMPIWAIPLAVCLFIHMVWTEISDWVDSR